MKLIVLSVSIIVHSILFIFFSFTFSDSSSGVTLTQGEKETVLSQTYIKFNKSEPLKAIENMQVNETKTITHSSKPSSDALGMQEQINKIVAQDVDESEKQESAVISEYKPKAESKVDDKEITKEVEKASEKDEQNNDILSMSDLSSSELEPEDTDTLHQQVNVQGDNKEHSSIGSQGQIDSGWLRYQEGVFAAINAQKKYPKQARLRRLEGVVIVEFEVDLHGKINRFNLVSKTNSEHLNRSTRKLFNELKLPKPSLELAGHFPSVMTIPIEYSLN